jgi:hypothetical protein
MLKQDNLGTPIFLGTFVAIMNQLMTEDSYALAMPWPITLKETE